ncbi:MAG: amidase [Rhodospirillales bacterium]|nr:amidase [Rhodospirillales bacterium]
MADLDLAYTPALALAKLIRERKVSPVQVVENSLARIAEVNPKLNCFCFVYGEEALAKAREAETAVTNGGKLGPLHGVPIAIKDVTPTKGKRTTMGSYVRENWVPNFDAIVVERLLGAGAIMVGKTTTPEFAHSSFTKSKLWGVTRNPWNPERTPGGSSGGAGAAVASGCVPIAEGSDMGGSVRAPAASCGLVGLKPSFGRIPFEIYPSVFDQTCHFGPLARTVDDAALFLQVAQGPDERDINSISPGIDVPVPTSADIKGLKLAYSRDLGFFNVTPEVEANTRAAVDSLRTCGATVDEVNLVLTPEDDAVGNRYWAVYHAALHAEHLPKWRDKMTPWLVKRIEDALKMSAVDFKKIEFHRTNLWNRLRAILAKYDALLCPTLTRTAPGAEQNDSDFSGMDDQGLYRGFELTFPFNMVAQCPALSVPSGFAPDGLPTALQIVGRRFDDLMVLRIAAALAAVRPWTDRRPPI